MHEHGLCVPVVDAIVERAQNRKVRSVRVRVGARHRVVAASFEEAFTHVAEGTVVAGAMVELVVSDAVGTCTACGAVVETNDPLDPCPACGTFGLRLDGGDEIVIEAVQFVGGVG